MQSDFQNDFANFMEEQLGKALFDLRSKNQTYRRLSDEYDALLQGQHDSTEGYRCVILKIAETIANLRDIEKRYLFLAGMRVCLMMGSALSSEEFEQYFIQVTLDHNNA